MKGTDLGMKIGTGKTTVFGRRLRLARRKRGWTRTHLEKVTGIKVSMIREYEDGRCLPRAPRLILLAQALGVDPAWLMPAEKEGEK
jgi:transcriptional regulator with XRE-family HTH domain